MEQVLIIQIRGTGGSGKTTVMKQVMDLLGEWEWEPVMVAGRKKPLYYRQRNLIVLGHYEAACGGCDTIGSAAQVYALIKTLPKSTIIICEGLLLSEDTKWSSQVEHELRIVYLTTPIEQCLSQIEGRRAAVGNEKPLNPKNTTKRVDVIERSRVKLTEQGILCRRASSTQAASIIIGWVKKR